MLLESSSYLENYTQDRKNFWYHLLEVSIILVINILRGETVHHNGEFLIAL